MGFEFDFQGTSFAAVLLRNVAIFIVAWIVLTAVYFFLKNKILKDIFEDETKTKEDLQKTKSFLIKGYVAIVITIGLLAGINVMTFATNTASTVTIQEQPIKKETGPSEPIKAAKSKNTDAEQTLKETREELYTAPKQMTK